jgi:CubicO group peptidase (beta-lactamase class C family)
MVATGGYVAAMADGGHVGQLHDAYLAAMQRHILGPIGMRRSTFDHAQAGTDPDHAQPHGVTLAGTYQPLALTTETWVQPIAPAAGLWSSADEMARYVLTELRRGVNPDGSRVISARNLEETWKPGVAIDANSSYGLGWMIEQWKGLRIITHGGNTNGFTTEVAFLPDADLGVVVLANAQEANVVTQGIRQRLLEIIYAVPSEIEPQLRTALEDGKTARAKLQEQLGPPITAARARTLVGDYRNPSLGPMTITFEDGALVADAGEFRVALRPLKASPPQGPAFVVADPPFVGRPARFDLTGAAPRLIYGAPPEEYVFDRVVTPATPVASPAA